MESEVSTNVFCICCGTQVTSAIHLMSCMQLRGFPVRVVSEGGEVVVSHGWATEFSDAHGIIVVHDEKAGGFYAWPAEWAKPIVEAS